MVMNEGLRASTSAFKASVTREFRCLKLDIVGEADTRAVEPLRSLLPKLHAEAVQWRATEVVVDMRRLEFMNSSCFKRFVMWVALAHEQGGHSYQIRFRIDSARGWQRRSVNALRCLAPRTVAVDG